MTKPPSSTPNPPRPSRQRAGALRQVASPAWPGGLAAGLLVTTGVYGDAYTASTLSRILVIGLLAASVAVLAGWCGLPSLGQVAPYAAGAYTAALLARHGQTAAPVQLAAAALAGAVLGVGIGLATLRARGTVYLMVSLAVGELTAVAAVQANAVTGGSDGLFVPATTWWWHATPLIDDRQVYLYTLAVTTPVVAATVLTLKSPAGLLLRALRDNETRMRATGHPVGRYLLLAHLGAGTVAGVGGALLATTQRYVSPADAGFDTAALVLLAVVIGGVTSVPGAFAAAGLVVVTRDWLAGPWPGHAPLLVGALLVLTVYVLPDRGLSGLVTALRRHRRKATAS